MPMFSQKYETHSYKTLFSDDSFEVRLYDPVLKAKTSNHWSGKYSKNYFSRYSFLAMDSLKTKVCERYAKF